MAPTAVPTIENFTSKDGTKPQVLVCANPIYGHCSQLAIIAADLVKRNYKVSFLTGTAYRAVAENTGATFIPCTGNADYNYTPDSPLFKEHALIAPGPEQLTFDLINIFFAPMAAQFSSIQQFLAAAASHAEPPVVIIHDPLFFGPTALKLGAPGLRPAGTIAIGITPLVISSIDTMPFGAGLPPDSSPAGRAANIAALAGFKTLFARASAAFAAHLASLGCPPTDEWFMDTVHTAPDLFLQLTIPEMEYPRSDLPRTVRFIGALPQSHPDAPPLPPWWPEVVAHAKPLVVVSQGTASNDPVELILPTLRALASRSDILVVATLVRSDAVEGFVPPANARVARFIPFEQLFPHANCVVNNGGYGTVNLAMSVGVPMVLAGLSEDKGEGNVRAAAAGGAVDLKTQTPGEGMIAEAVGRVLGEKRFAERARELAGCYGRLDALGMVVGAVEEVGGKGEVVLN